MVFHSGQPTGAKKSGIGYQKGASYRVYQEALAKAPVPEDPDPADAESDDDEREHALCGAWDEACGWGGGRGGAGHSGPELRPHAGGTRGRRRGA